MDDITAIISTFERNEAIENLIKSIREYYPDLKILIADDSENPKEITGENIQYYSVPFDMGLSYKRNLLVRLAETPYILLLDDDFEFTPQTDIKALRDALIKHKLDIVAGDVINDAQLNKYRGLLEVSGDVLRQIDKSEGVVGEVILYDIVLNFFVAKRESLLEHPWDNELKICEHSDFFLRGKDKLRVGYLDGVVVKNNKTPYNPGYGHFRRRGNSFTDLFMDKHGLTKIIGFDGNIRENLGRGSETEIGLLDVNTEVDTEREMTTKEQARYNTLKRIRQGLTTEL